MISDGLVIGVNMEPGSVSIAIGTDPHIILATSSRSAKTIKTICECGCFITLHWTCDALRFLLAKGRICVSLETAVRMTTCSIWYNRSMLLTDAESLNVKGHSSMHLGLECFDSFWWRSLTSCLLCYVFWWDTNQIYDQFPVVEYLWVVMCLVKWWISVLVCADET